MNVLFYISKITRAISLRLRRFGLRPL